MTRYILNRSALMAVNPGGLAKPHLIDVCGVLQDLYLSIFDETDLVKLRLSVPGDKTSMSHHTVSQMLL